MGQVWLAEQSAPVKRRVALKLIKGGLYDNAVIQRFESERQSVAVMNHPTIAKVFDAGSTKNGQPYFVMEYVDGVTITRYCHPLEHPRPRNASLVPPPKGPYLKSFTIITLELLSSACKYSK